MKKELNDRNFEDMTDFKHALILDKFVSELIKRYDMSKEDVFSSFSLAINKYVSQFEDKKSLMDNFINILVTDYKLWDKNDV